MFDAISFSLKDFAALEHSYIFTAIKISITSSNFSILYFICFAFRRRRGVSKYAAAARGLAGLCFQVVVRLCSDNNCVQPTGRGRVVRAVSPTSSIEWLQLISLAPVPVHSRGYLVITEAEQYRVRGQSVTQLFQ